jgi:hypothetical protein
MIIKLSPDYSAEVTRVEWFLTRFVNTYGMQFPNIVRDYAALLWLVKTYEVQSFCEIGTWEGYCSLCMWVNSTIVRQKAIDICSDFEGGGMGYHQGLSEYGRYFVDITPVVLEKADTLVYQPTSEDVYDMVFVDGNHNYVNVRNDAKLAVKMGTRVIAFHDYENGNSGVDMFLYRLGMLATLVNIVGSAVVFLEVTPENVSAINAV